MSEHQMKTQTIRDALQIAAIADDIINSAALPLCEVDREVLTFILTKHLADEEKPAKTLDGLKPSGKKFESVTELMTSEYASSLNLLARHIHVLNHKWWHDNQGAKIARNKGELLCLVHSEISEAMEGERKDLMDDKLPHRKMAEVEMADALIRILDYCAGFGYDIEGAVKEKLAFNSVRPDHKHEAREQANGKKW